MFACSDGPDSTELVAELTEKLLAGKKTEVFGFLQTLPALRAQRLKEKLIEALKKVPHTPSPNESPLGPRTTEKSEEPRPRTYIEPKRTNTGSDGNVGRSRSSSMDVKKASSVPSSPLAGGRQTRSVCGGRYLIGECVGRGNFGRVYNALDKNTGQFVAVKEIGCSNFNKVLFFCDYLFVLLTNL